MTGPCTKVRFESRPEAEDALLRARVHASLRLGRHHQRRKERRAYYCGLCRGFHLTSQPVKDSREVAS